MSCLTDIRGLVVSISVLPGDSLNFMCVDLTLEPVELLVVGPTFCCCCGEKITDVCGKDDVIIVAVDRTVVAVVTCSVIWTSIFEDAILDLRAFVRVNFKVAPRHSQVR